MLKKELLYHLKSHGIRLLMVRLGHMYMPIVQIMIH